jgi:dihydrofolate reductase
VKSIIVAYDKNRGIGVVNGLLWKNDLPADLRHFKDITMNSTIIMGRKTYESIGRALPGRQSIVISRGTALWEGALVVASLDDAYSAASSSDVFVIGGGQIYEIAINSVDQVLATEVDGQFNADTFFPKLEPTIWKEVSRRHHDKDTLNKYNYDFVTYARC